MANKYLKDSNAYIPEKFNYSVRRNIITGEVFFEVEIQEIKRKFKANKKLNYDEFIKFKRGYVNKYIEHLDKIIRYVLKYGYHNNHYYCLWKKWLETGEMPFSKKHPDKPKKEYPSLTPYIQNNNLKFRVYYRHNFIYLNSHTRCDEHDLYNAQHYPVSKFEKEIDRIIDKTNSILYNIPFDKEAIKEAFELMIRREPVYV